MTDQQPHTPIIPTTEIVENQFVYYEAAFMKISNEASRARFRVWLEEVVAAAEQRGAEQAFRKTQEIIAGFDHTIDEARNRDDMINTGYLIQEIDTEIQDLMEDDDDEGDDDE